MGNLILTFTCFVYRLNTPENAKAILARGVASLPNSVKIWTVSYTHLTLPTIYSV